ncbi:MAG: hypothetical protein V1858_00870 [Candidatus Gottesmanbacteria bacterium]
MAALINGQKMRERLVDLLNKTSDIGEKSKIDNQNKTKDGNR